MMTWWINKRVGAVHLAIEYGIDSHHRTTGRKYRNIESIVP